MQKNKSRRRNKICSLETLFLSKTRSKHFQVQVGLIPRFEYPIYFLVFLRIDLNSKILIYFLFIFFYIHRIIYAQILRTGNILLTNVVLYFNWTCSINIYFTFLLFEYSNYLYFSTENSKSNRKISWSIYCLFIIKPVLFIHI